MSDPTQTTSSGNWYDGLFTLAGQALQQEFQLDALELQSQVTNPVQPGVPNAPPIVIRETTSGGSNGTMTPQMTAGNFGGMGSILLIGGAILAAVFVAKG
jgi:hypothetical protein